MPYLLSVSKNYEEDEADNVKNNHQDAKHADHVKQGKLDSAQKDRPASFHLSTVTVHCSHFAQSLFSQANTQTWREKERKKEKERGIQQYIYVMGVNRSNYTPFTLAKLNLLEIVYSK